MVKFMTKNVSSIILAAGEGTRMKSACPKVLHLLGGKALLSHILDTAKDLRLAQNVLVTGFSKDQVLAYLAQQHYDDVHIAVQREQLGSGHAVLQAAKFFAGFSGDVLILCADVPLIKKESLENLVSQHRKQKNAATILTTRIGNPFGYGRIVRNGDNGVEKIIEEKDASEIERKIDEINSGIYCFKAELLFKVLGKIKPNNKKKEYYLTDAIELLRRQNLKIGAMLSENNWEVMGINDRVQLAEAEAWLNRQKLNSLMQNGVTILDPKTVWIDADVTIGRDTVIYPNTMIQGKSSLGEGCAVGPGSLIKDSVIGNNVEMRASFIYEAEIGNKVKIGPFSHIRPKVRLAQGAKVGNFVEIKKSDIGTDSKISHLTYVGDATVGDSVNIGAGVITCNYDGVNKYHSLIEDKVFVGSNVNLVAPVKIGQGAVIGAGSTITENVPAKALALARSRQVNKENWVRKKEVR